MRWFRSNIRFGSRFALFALALQIALTFTHVHIDGPTGALAKSTPISVANRSSGAALSSASLGQKSKGLADADCPICALIQLAATAAPSVAPDLPVPATFIVIRAPASDEAALPTFSFFPFQARAPPSA